MDVSCWQGHPVLAFLFLFVSLNLDLFGSYLNACTVELQFYLICINPRPLLFESLHVSIHPVGCHQQHARTYKPTKLMLVAKIYIQNQKTKVFIKKNKMFRKTPWLLLDKIQNNIITSTCT